MTVGVVLSDARADGEIIAATLREFDVEPVVGSPESVLEADPDWTITVGEPALGGYVRAGGRGPVLAVDCDAGVPAVSATDHVVAIETLLEDTPETEARELLSVTVDGTETGTVLFEVMLVTAEPARISEYTVTKGGEEITEIRADGIVLATPAGSSGYAGDAGGPIIQPETGVVSVVPVAPFVTNSSHWVLDAEDVTFTVERDEPVELVLDGSEFEPVSKGSAVHVSPADTCEFFSLPDHRRWHTRH